MDSADEQTAAIRRELDGRNHRVAEMEKVSPINSILSLLPSLLSFIIFLIFCCCSWMIKRSMAVHIKKSWMNETAIAFTLLLHFIFSISISPMGIGWWNHQKNTIQCHCIRLQLLSPSIMIQLVRWAIRNRGCSISLSYYVWGLGCVPDIHTLALPLDIGYDFA